MAVIVATPDPTGAQNANDCSSGIAVSNPTRRPALVADCEALLAAKPVLAGTATLNWSADTPISGWTGITVASDRVVAVELGDAGLNGSLSPFIGHLDAVVRFDLSENRLRGTITDQFGNLTALSRLDLSGTMPATVGYVLGINRTPLETACCRYPQSEFIPYMQ